MQKWKQFMGRLVAGGFAVLAVVAMVAVSPIVAPVSDAQAAVYTNFVGNSNDFGPGAQQQYRLSATLDFSTTPVSSNDVVDLIRVPSNSYIAKVVWQCTTAGTNSAPTFDLGDYASATRYGSVLSLTGASRKATCMGTTVYATNSGASVQLPAQRWYDSNDAVPVRSAANGNMRTGVLKVDVLFEPFGP